jgi:hypothetical protein
MTDYSQPRMLSSAHFPAMSLLLWAFVSLNPLPVAAHEIEAGPLFHQFKLTLDSGHQTEAVGPLYYQQTLEQPNDLTRLWAAPPLFSYTRNDDTDYEALDILWKGITYHRYGEEYRFQILQLFSFGGGGTQSETNIHRFTLFPIYFQQRSQLPEKDYTALLPIYGHLQGRLFRNEIKFVLFPLYAQTRKRDVVTDNFLFPVFHYRRGIGLNGWQVWPLIGREHKDVTTKTNAWGDSETVGGHDKFFVLWPIFSDEQAGLGTENPTHQQATLPLYSFLRSPMRDSTTFFWPLGVTHTVDRVKKFDEWGAPWPLIVFTRGSGKTANRVWPFFSHAHNASFTSEWYLWPIYKYNRLHSDPLDRERTRILFFLYSDLSVKHTETGARLRRRDLWPLFTWKRDLEGKSRLQILSLLEPFLPNNPSVDRNLSPLWSLWRSEQNPATGAASQSLLWNLYRRDAAPDSRKLSLLFGLFRYQSGSDGSRWRVFHIPFGKSKPGKPPSP